MLELFGIFSLLIFYVAGTIFIFYWISKRSSEVMKKLKLPPVLGPVIVSIPLIFMVHVSSAQISLMFRSLAVVEAANNNTTPDPF